MDSFSSQPPHKFPPVFVPGNNGVQIETDNGTFWTLCPYCYYLYEYEGIYKDCCLICQNCSKPFHGLSVPPPPPDSLVEGKDQYYCGIGYFSLKYNLGSSLSDKKGENLGIKVEKKGNGEGFKADLENLVLISDDDDDDNDDWGIGEEEQEEEEECKNEGDFNLSVLQESNLGTKSQEAEMKKKKKKKKVHYKMVARNTKKQMGRGIRCVGLKLNGKTNSDVEESKPETAGRNGSQKEEVFSEDDLDLDIFLGVDDIYIDLKDL